MRKMWKIIIITLSFTTHTTPHIRMKHAYIALALTLAAVQAVKLQVDAHEHPNVSRAIQDFVTERGIHEFAEESALDVEGLRDAVEGWFAKTDNESLAETERKE